LSNNYFNVSNALLPNEKSCRRVSDSTRSYSIWPGSIIISDMWRAYDLIPADYQHLTVNHSLHFVDPDTGAHTNTIEATWNAIKRTISPQNRRTFGMEEELWAFMWRRAHHNDLWGGFINALKNVDYQ
jgi:hypothetical protein